MAVPEVAAAEPATTTIEDLKPGDPVEAIGLTESGQKDLNGLIGVLIKRYSKKNGGRLEVRFTDNGKPKIIALDPENSCVPGGLESQREKTRKEAELKAQSERQKTTRGKYVEVFGLESEKGKLMNGQRGIVIKKVEASGRIEVSLGKDGKLTSLKPECLNLVVGADATELANAKEIAFPHLKAAMEELQSQMSQGNSTDASASATQAHLDAERERSWSPPPEARQAASSAALQAASMASSRGYSAEQAEAYGAAAAERALQYAKEVDKAQKIAAKAQAAAGMRPGAPGTVPGIVGMVPGLVPGMVQGMVPGMVQTMHGVVAGLVPGMVQGMVPGMVPVQGNVFAAAPAAPPPPAAPREVPTSLETCKIGDSVEAFGLKGGDLEALNGDKGVIQNMLGWTHKKRYLVKFEMFVIDDNGDLAAKDKVVTLTAENLRLPGTGDGDADDDDDDDAGDDALGDDDDAKSKSRSKSKSKSRSKSRSRSKGRSRRKSSGRSRRRSRSRRR